MTPATPVSVRSHLATALAVGVFLISLLAIVPAPTYALWQLSVFVTELGHVAALGCIAVVILVRPARHVALLGLVAAALLATPVVRGYRFARETGHRWDLTELFATSSAGCVSQELVYARAGARLGLLDFYRSESVEGDGASGRATRGAPLVVVVHGGSWTSGTRGEFPSLTCDLVREGFAVADVDYRLAPADPYPAAADDVAAAVEYLRREQSTLGVDASRVVLLGRSAGGHLALSVGYRASMTDAVRAVIALYAPADLIFGYEHPASPWVMDSRKTLRDFLGGSPADRGELYRAGSPYLAVGPRTPPTLLVHGTRDELVFVAQSRRLAARLAEAGRPHSYFELPWATHACDYVPVGPCGLLVRGAVRRFLDDVLGPVR